MAQRRAFELRQRARQRVVGMVGSYFDRTILSLIGRESVHRLVDDILGYLVASPNMQRLVDDIVDYISRQPAVRELVQEQGQHLTDEVIDEARQHIYRGDVTVNDFISAARNRLRRAPQRRAELNRPR